MLTNDVVSFEQPGPVLHSIFIIITTPQCESEKNGEKSSTLKSREYSIHFGEIMFSRNTRRKNISVSAHMHR